MSIVLIGFKSSGKSTLAAAYAQRVGQPLLDCDHLLEEAWQQETGAFASFRDIYRTVGEQTFRQREAAVLQSLAGQQNTVVATGGGVVHCPHAPELLRAVGLVVFVDTAPEVVERRLAGVNSPLFATGSFMDLYAQRRPLYLAAAQVVFTISCEEGAAQLAARLQNQLEDRHHGA